MDKIGVVIPWDSPFIWTMPMFNMLNWEVPEGCKVRFFSGVGWCPAAKHNDGVSQAKAWGADYVMFNGGDHVVEEDVLCKLYEHIKYNGWDMATGWIASRGSVGPGSEAFPHLAFKMVDKPVRTLKGEFPILNYSKEDWEILTYGAESQQIHCIGTGLLMMKIGIFEGLEPPPFYEIIDSSEAYTRHPVQDTHFVYRCTVEAGAKLWLDTTIKAQHVDAFLIDNTFTFRFRDKRGNKSWMPKKDMLNSVPYPPVS